MNEDAISPVIGVILMVAITVILAAVIAAFVFGLSGQMAMKSPEGLTECSALSKVTDKYMTPNYNYIQVNGNYLYQLSIENYDKVRIGDYVHIDIFGEVSTLNVIELSEYQTGYRDACKVLDRVECERQCESHISYQRACNEMFSKTCSRER